MKNIRYGNYAQCARRSNDITSLLGALRYLFSVNQFTCIGMYLLYLTFLYVFSLTWNQRYELLEDKNQAIEW